MKTIARLLGGGADSEQKMMDIYDFENKIAQVRVNNKFDGDFKFFFQSVWSQGDKQSYSSEGTRAKEFLLSLIISY